jgi:hypothetical protein
MIQKQCYKYNEFHLKIYFFKQINITEFNVYKEWKKKIRF